MEQITWPTDNSAALNHYQAHSSLLKSQLLTLSSELILLRALIFCRVLKFLISGPYVCQYVCLVDRIYSVYVLISPVCLLELYAITVELFL